MTFEQIKSWAERVFSPDKTAQRQFALFQELLREDKKCLKLITRLEEIVRRPILSDWSRIALLARALSVTTHRLINCLLEMRPSAYSDLTKSHARIDAQLWALLPRPLGQTTPPYAMALEKALDHPDLVGGKALALARILRQTDIPLPPGFVVTTNAFRVFLHENNLERIIARHLRTLDLRRPERLRKAAAHMRQCIMESAVPQAVQESILSFLEQAAGASASITWAVRSSAAAEDGEASFAGQYATVLDVAKKDILNAYKTVLASKYDARALTYRLHYGLDDGQTPMAVLVLPMIQPRTSGVLYSLDPLDVCRGACLVISAVPGLGASLVDGSTAPDIYLVSRQNPAHFLAKQAAPKQGLAGSPGPGRAEKNALCLDEASATTLAKWGLELEALAGAPQDVEWTQDQEGRLFVLQSRPIHFSAAAQSETEQEDTPPPSDHIAVLLEVGTPASVGIATGVVHRLADDADLDQAPANVILVTTGIPPSLVRLVHKVRAVLAEQGGKASHFASVAREFGLPLIVGMGDLGGILAQGQTVTVDAYRGVVYDGEVSELLTWQENRKTKPALPFQEKMAPMLALISPLSLTDPDSPDFAPKNCRSFHDLVRFVHEMGTREMFSLVDVKGRGLRRVKTLKTDLPIVMHVLDLDAGLIDAARELKTVGPKHVQSAPMLAVWAGLTDQDISWSKGLLHVDWERFDQVSGGIFSMKSSFLSSYALLARHYAHLLLRFGYHFAVLDALSGEHPDENYIQFRFKGGGGGEVKKSWRLAMVGKVLTGFGFQVLIREDMLEAKCSRLDRHSTDLRLRVLGYLLGRTPLLDMALESEADALRMADELLDKWQNKASTS